MPDLLHVIPVGHDTVLNGVLQGEDTPLGLGLVSDVGVLLSHANHDTLVTGTANDEGKTALGASSPANPALHMPDPLSTTRAATSSSHILLLFFVVVFWRKLDHRGALWWERFARVPMYSAL